MNDTLLTTGPLSPFKNTSGMRQRNTPTPSPSTPHDDAGLDAVPFDREATRNYLAFMVLLICIICGCAVWLTDRIHRYFVSFTNGTDIFYKSSFMAVIGCFAAVGSMIIVSIIALLIFRVLEQADLPEENLIYKAANGLYKLVRNDDNNGTSIGFGKVSTLVVCIYGVIFVVGAIAAVVSYEHLVEIRLSFFEAPATGATVSLRPSDTQLDNEYNPLGWSVQKSKAENQIGKECSEGISLSNMTALCLAPKDDNYKDCELYQVTVVPKLEALSFAVEVEDEMWIGQVKVEATGICGGSRTTALLYIEIEVNVGNDGKESKRRLAQAAQAAHRRRAKIHLNDYTFVDYYLFWNGILLLSCFCGGVVFVTPCFMLAVCLGYTFKACHHCRC